MVKRRDTNDTIATELILRAQAGDRDAFDKLVALHEPAVLHMARRFVPEEDARDVAQRTFVRAFVGLHAFRGDSAFGTWLCKIARNLALNHRRDVEKLEPLDDVEHLPARPSSPGRAVDRELREKLLAAVGRLPPKQKLVVELRLFRDRSFREIAAVADCSEEAAKSNFHHATKRLKKWLS
jgi:RNA polymerase sigma-70 factor (ECF subfamily)